MNFVSPCYFFLFLRHDMIRPGRDFKLKDISIVMSLSLHCQSCQKYRRRVVVTLPPNWRPLWQLWRPLWRQCGGNVAAMWRQCGGHVAAMWRQCGGDVAAMWRRCGGDVAAMWWQCGGDVAAMWRRCDGDVVAMWRQCGDAVLTKSRQLSYRKTMIACIIETKQKSCGLENFTPQKNIYIANLESRSFLPRTRKPSKFTVMSIPKLWMHLGVFR